MTSDIKLTKEHDLSIEGNDFVLFTTKEDSITQRLKIGLSLVASEWFLDESKGLPFTDPNFNQKGAQVLMDAYVRQFITNFEGILSLTTYSSELQGDRTSKITFSTVTDSGEIIKFSEVL